MIQARRVYHDGRRAVLVDGEWIEELSKLTKSELLDRAGDKGDPSMTKAELIEAIEA